MIPQATTEEREKMNYEEFLESKKKLILPTGKIIEPESVHKILFVPFTHQRRSEYE